MSSKVTQLLDYLNTSAMQDFMKLSSKKKAREIFSNYQNYYMNLDKVSKAKTDEEKDRLDIQAERLFALAVGQVKSLSESELTDYLSHIESRLSKALETKDDVRLLSSRMLFGTIIRQLPESLLEYQQPIRDRIDGLMDEFGNQFER